ncbi:MAG: zf-HC2 domain-containing protein [Acidobacteriota bacterium]|jgi:anti-sigma factor RsiW|nr:zf-HC2 domain-containing protein [Acidobacteriota bacterium]
MDCRNFHRNLEDYIDGELDFAGRFGVERHAEQCFACGKKLADARRLRLMTASLARVKAPADFEARVRREIALRKSQGIFTRVRNYLAFGFEWRRFVFAASACAALALGIFFARQLPHYEPVPAVAENPGFAAEAVAETEVVETPENLKMEALDLLLISPDNRQTPEQLPRKIYVRYGPPSEEYFIKNVSH